MWNSRRTLHNSFKYPTVSAAYSLELRLRENVVRSLRNSCVFFAQSAEERARTGFSSIIPAVPVTRALGRDAVPYWITEVKVFSNC